MPSSRPVPFTSRTAPRLVRFVGGTAILVLLAPTALEVADRVVTSRAEGAPAGALGAEVALLAALGALVTFGASLAVHAIRGTKALHPAVPLAIALPCLLAVGVQRAGGVARVIAGEMGTAMVLVASLVTLAIALAAHVLVHEAGHLVAARLVGSRFQSVRVGPLLLRKQGKRLRVARSRFRPAGVLGWAHSVPADGDGFARRLAITVLGGPLATAALTIALWLGARALGPPAEDAGQVASFGLWHATFAGVFLSVVNLLPRRLGSGVRTDGALLHLALGARRRPAAQAFLEFLLGCKQGRRPRAWGTTAEAYLAAADQDRNPPPELRLAALNVALDTGDFPRAESILAQGAPARCAPCDPVRQEFALQAALLAALVHGDPATARVRLAGVGPMALPEYPLLAESAAALAEGDEGAARTLLARWRESVDASGLPALRVGNEWAEELVDARLGAAGRGAA